MYSQDKDSRPSVVETNSTSLELSLPVNQNYVIQIKPFSEGGEGRSSHQITIPKIAGGSEQWGYERDLSTSKHRLIKVYVELWFRSSAATLNLISSEAVSEPWKGLVIIKETRP